MIRERLGLLGGTFDPPHVGHLAAAVEARAALGLDRVLLVVANEPWQKVDARTLSAASVRLALTMSACEGIAGVEASDLEIERGGLTYTIDTLEHLRRSMPGTDLFLILGSDAVVGLSTWHRHDELPSLATLVVVDREGERERPPPVGWDVEHVRVPRLDVSSTDLRDRVAAGRPIGPYVPAPVVDIIGELALYGSAGS